MTPVIESVWVFSGEGGKFPGGVFLSLDAAEAWIAKHGLTGVLTLYPLDVGAYDWAIAKGIFEPKNDHQRTPSFIGKFSSAGQDHYHFENGKRG
jgi:hypothetical protein